MKDAKHLPSQYGGRKGSFFLWKVKGSFVFEIWVEFTKVQLGRLLILGTVVNKHRKKHQASCVQAMVNCPVWSRRFMKR